MPKQPERDIETIVRYIVSDVNTVTGHTTRLNKLIERLKARYALKQQPHKDTIKANMKLARKWAKAHPERFIDKKSIELLHGIMGFRTSPHKCELLDGHTWESVLEKLQLSELGNEYIRKTPEVDKEKLIADRENIAEFICRIGVEITQDEKFFVEAKQEKPIEARQTL